jgi:hypothetical protein
MKTSTLIDSSKQSMDACKGLVGGSLLSKLLKHGLSTLVRVLFFLLSKLMSTLTFSFPFGIPSKGIHAITPAIHAPCCRCKGNNSGLWTNNPRRINGPKITL